MTSFTDRFGGITIYPSDIGYLAYSLTTSATLTWPELGDTSSNLAASFIRASSTVTGAGFIMPDARDVSVGRVERIKNIGSIAIPVFSTSGSTIATISAGQDYMLSLIDNTTSGGLWDTSQLGIGTSSADAAFLAGNGLTTSGSKLAVNWPVYYTGSNGFLLTGSANGVVNTWTGGTGAIKMASDSITQANGFITAVKNDGSGVLTVSGASFGSIDGASSITLFPNASTFIVGDGTGLTNYFTIGLNSTIGISVLPVIVSVSQSSVTLTATQAGANNVIVFTGTPAAQPEFSVVFPQTAGLYTIVNKMVLNNIPRAGGGYMTIRTSAAGGASIRIYAGSTRQIFNDGTNITFADDMTERRQAKNYMYYADMSINPWQRGTTFTCSGTSMYTADRVMFACSGAFTIARQTSTNTGCQYDMRIQRTSGSSQAYVGFDLDVPESIALRGKAPTLVLEMSFSGTYPNFLATIYSNVTGGLRIVDTLGSTWPTVANFGGPAIMTTGGSSLYYTFATNRYTTNQSSAVLSNSVNQVSVLITFASAGTGASDMVNIARMALVDGEFSSFDALAVEDAFNKCRRFAWVPTASAAGQTFLGGQSVSANGASMPVQYPVPMRNVPSLTVTAANFQLTTSTGAASSVSSCSFTGGTINGGELTIVTVSSLLAAGNSTRLQSSTSISNLLFSADI